MWRETHLLALHRYTEEDDALETLLYERTEEALDLVHAPAALSWERRNFDDRLWVIGDEYRVHKHALGESALRLPGARKRMLVASLEDRAACPRKTVVSIRRVRYGGFLRYVEASHVFGYVDGEVVVGGRVVQSKERSEAVSCATCSRRALLRGLTRVIYVLLTVIHCSRALHRDCSYTLIYGPGGYTASEGESTGT